MLNNNKICESTHVPFTFKCMQTSDLFFLPVGFTVTDLFIISCYPCFVTVYWILMSMQINCGHCTLSRDVESKCQKWPGDERWEHLSLVFRERNCVCKCAWELCVCICVWHWCVLVCMPMNVLETCVCPCVCV